jgi:glycine oxidase
MPGLHYPGQNAQGLPVYARNIAAMTNACEVVVIGGGVVGVAAARMLAQKGLSCVVLEKDSVGSHASGFAYGGLHPFSGSDIPGALTGMARRGFELHRTLGGELPETTGVDTEYRRKSTLSLSFTGAEARAARDHLGWMRGEGANAEWLAGDAVQSVEPRVSREALGAVLNHDTAEVEPYKFVLALAQDAETLGVRILNRRAVSFTRSGTKLTGVALDDGDVLTCDSVLIAAGPWTEELAASSDTTVGIRPLKGQILRLDAPGEPYEHSIGWAGNYVTSKPDGLVWAGTTEEDIGFDENITTEARDEVMDGLLTMVPGLADARLVKQTACLRPISGDGLPVIGALPGWEGVTVCTGAGRKGILLGPAMAEMAVELLTGSRSNAEYSAFSPDRFGAPG